MKRIKKLFVFALSLVLLLSGISLNGVETHAATGKTHKVKISLSETKTVHVQSGKKNVKKKTVTVEKGDKISFSYVKNKTINSVTYKSMNKKYVTITKKGKATAKKAGTAKIKITVKQKQGKSLSTWVKLKVKENTKPEDNGKPSALRFDFEDGDCGFVPIFSDYPNSDGVEEFYEMRYEHGEIPIPEAGKGLFISGNNHSDDLFMGYFKKIDGLVAGQKYEFNIKFKIATNVPGGMVGVGGSPGESVYVKSGITAVKPENSVDDIGHFRLNIDSGHQGESGKDMSVVGTIAKQDEMNPGGYDFNVYELSATAATDENGEVYLIIGTDSGFESATAYYIDDVELSWK